MKYILKISSVTKTELKLELGKNTFTIPASPEALKKAKAAMRKGNNIAITIDGEMLSWGTSSAKPNVTKVPTGLDKYWDQYVPPVNKEHAYTMTLYHLELHY